MQELMKLGDNLSDNTSNGMEKPVLSMFFGMPVIS